MNLDNYKTKPLCAVKSKNTKTGAITTILVTDDVQAAVKMQESLTMLAEIGHTDEKDRYFFISYYTAYLKK